MKYLHRTIEDKIIKGAKFWPVILVVGARQTGKSTLLSNLSKDNKIPKSIPVINLRNTGLREMAESDPAGFLKKYGTPLIIDEIQLCPVLLEEIKVIVDDKRREDKDHSYGMYFLTGSQKFELMKNVSESLAGIVGIYNLLPLSNGEVEGYKNELFIPSKDRYLYNKVEHNPNIYEKIFRGFYPEVVLDGNTNREHFYESYIQTYISKDVRAYQNIKDENLFRKFMEIMAVNTGQELIIDRIGVMLGLHNKTVESWISILKANDIISIINPFYTSHIKRVTKRCKVYFNDTGLACYLAHIDSPETLSAHHLGGAFFETFVVDEIVKSFANNAKNTSMYFYWLRTNSLEEIDFIIDYDMTLYPIEIKATRTPRKSFVKHFRILNKEKKHIGIGTVICNTTTLRPIDKDNYFVPYEVI